MEIWDLVNPSVSHFCSWPWARPTTGIALKMNRETSETAAVRKAYLAVAVHGRAVPLTPVPGFAMCAPRRVVVARSGASY